VKLIGFFFLCLVGMAFNLVPAVADEARPRAQRSELDIAKQPTASPFRVPHSARIFPDTPSVHDFNRMMPQPGTPGYWKFQTFPNPFYRPMPTAPGTSPAVKLPSVNPNPWLPVQEGNSLTFIVDGNPVPAGAKAYRFLIDGGVEYSY